MSDYICHVCNELTELACSDCRLNFGVSVHVCSRSSCRDEHEKMCFGDGHKAIIPRPQYEALMAAAKASLAFEAAVTVSADQMTWFPAIVKLGQTNAALRNAGIERGEGK